MPTGTPASNRSARAFSFDRGQFINGRWRDGSTGRKAKDTDLYSGDMLAEFVLADASDVDAAYQSALQAQAGWAEQLPEHRSDVLRRACGVMEVHRDEIIRWIIRESGSTRIKASLEWSAVYGVLRDAATMPYRLEGRILPVDVPGKESRVYRKPVGVVGVISPWNWPFQLSSRSVFPALATGNSVVLKPASDTPVTGGLLLAAILEEAGLPPGVLNVVVGAGRDVGDDFIRHRIPRVISFTGSTPVGRGIARLAADASIIKRVELELGGNSPVVVLEDADVEQTVEAAIFGKFLHQGQICMSANRFIVANSVYDDFVNRFAERVRNLKCGNPDEPDTMVGPIINQGQLDGLLERIREARESGAREVVGGAPEGMVLPPHVYADVTNDYLVAREELFGPIAPIIRAGDEEDALRIANDTEHGLSSAVFTRDLERGTRFALRIQAGMAHVNDQPVNDLPGSPFGGEKNSGIGRFNGDWAIHAFTTDQWVTVQHRPRQYPTNARELDGAWGGG